MSYPLTATYIPSKLSEAYWADFSAPTASEDGKVLQWNNGTGQFEWVTAGGGGGTPGGSDTQVQFNNSGSFGGDAGLTYASGTDTLTVSGSVVTPVIKPASDSTTALQLQTSGGTAVLTVDTTNSDVYLDRLVPLNAQEAFAIGHQAGDSNTTGLYWTAIGYQAGNANTIGNYWNAIGYRAAYLNVSGQHFNAYGYRAAYSNTSGGFFNAFGRDAGYSNTEGNYWNAFGYLAGYSNTTGDFWSAFGREAGYSATTTNYWTAIGYQALYNATGTANQAFGYRAGDNITTASYCTIIGYDLDAPAGATTNYQLAIAGYIEGDGSSLTLQPRTAGNGVTITTVTTDKVGFHGSTPVAQQSVTGSRGGNAALADLLTKLDTLGIINDTTSA